MAMKRLEITAPNAFNASTTKVLLDGEDIGNQITAIEFAPLEAGKPVVAKLAFFVSSMTLAAQAMLSLETVNETAALYGFRLVPIEDAE